MTATLLFVHGTSVRGDAVDRDQRMFTDVFRPSDVVAPKWGEEFGITANTDFSLSLPPGSRQVHAAGAVEIEGPSEFVDAARLMVLVEDPLLELRAAAGDAEPAEATIALPGAGGGDPIADQLRDGVERLSAGTALEGTGLSSSHLRAAAELLLADPATLVVAAEDAGMTLVADALLAGSISQALASGAALDDLGVATSAEVQSRFVGELDQALGTSRGIGAWASGKLVRKAADVLRKRVTPMLSWFVADILMYYARREEILASFRDLLDRLTDDGTEVVILAHSLGGIAMVDLFCEPDPPTRGVRHLVTAGSQASAVQLMGTRDRANRVPISWTNFYDPADFIGFYAGSVFPGAVDEEVTSGAVNAHCAYWESDKLRTHVRGLLA